MSTTAISDYNYICGCVRHADQTWTLCASCDVRIGMFGTCLECGGAANEQWVTSPCPDETFCSEQCANNAALIALIED